MVRVGTDLSRDLQNLKAVRISYKVTSSTVCDFDSLWIGGSYGPDVLPAGNPYLYRYRGRDSSTGARGNWSPALRSGILPKRQRVTVSVTGLNATTWLGVDKLDIQRFGGTKNEWTYIGTVANDTSGATVDFSDDYSDTAIASNPTGEENNFALWPITDVVKSGTGYATGTAFIAVTGTFNTSWAPGTAININGINHVIYGTVPSTTRLNTVDNIGTVGSSGSPVKWYISEPIIMSQPLPSMWGPVEGFFFAVGDARAQGTVYFTNGNNPDSTSESHKIEITSPSEPLMNGVAYNGRSYVFSSERLFALYPSFGSRSISVPGELQTDNLWRPLEVPNGKGLFSRWALAVGPKIWFLSRDGIYETTGGESVCITDDDLYPLFPHDGQAGESTNGVIAPDMTAPTKLRLAYYDGFLYFDYFGTDSLYHTLVYNTVEKAWESVDEYAGSIVMHYGEEGTNVNAGAVHSLLAGGTAASLGKVYQFAGTSDDGTAISCRILTPSNDNGDPRSLKLWGDTWLDMDAGGVVVSVQQGFNENTTTLTAGSATGSGRTRYPFTANSGLGQEGYNACIDITWSSSTGTPKLYFWEFLYLAYPSELLAWQTHATSHGLNGFQHLRDGYISLISTDTVTLTILVDGSSFAYTIPSTAGVHAKTYLQFQVMKGKLFSYQLTSPAKFRHFQWDSEIRVKSWGDAGPYRSFNPFGERAAI